MSRAPNLEAREKILKAAFALMYERGFKGVSMDDVAEAAGVKKANLFHYYPTKEELGLAVFDHAAVFMRERVAKRFAKEGDPIRRVEGMFSEAAGGMKGEGCRRGCFIGNFAQELSDSCEKMRVKISEYFRFWAGEVAGTLERSRGEGYFRKDFKPKESAEAILALFEGATMFCKAKKDVKPLEDAKHMASAYLRGYKK